VRRRTAPAVALLPLILCACSTEFVTVAPDVSTEAPRLGHVRGVAYSHILFGSPTYNIIPIGWDGRAQRACDEAIGCVPGATGLVDVTLEEDWFWWVIGSARKLVLEGDAVKR